MPAYTQDNMYEGGLRGVVQFVAKLADHLPEQWNERFENFQSHLMWEGMELEKANEEVELKNDEFKDFIKESVRPNSTWGRMIRDWTVFANANGIAITEATGFKGFFGKRIRWEKATYKFGGNASPGQCYIPAKLMEEGEAAEPVVWGYVKPADNGSGGTTAPADKEVPGELISGVAEVMDGAMNADSIKQAFMIDTANRVKITKVGGMAHVLEAAVASGVLTLDESEEEPTYSVA